MLKEESDRIGEDGEREEPQPKQRPKTPYVSKAKSNTKYVILAIFLIIALLGVSLNV